MAHTKEKDKISNEFLTRINNYEPNIILRVILMLEYKVRKPHRRLTRTERLSILKKIRKSNTGTLKKIDDLLKTYGGKRISLKINALGCITVETTVRGIHALAELKEIKAIFEDQPISVLQDLQSKQK